MKLDFISNDWSANIIVFVKKHDETFYCFSNKEYWIVEWWDGYVDAKKGKLEDLYFEFVQRFKVSNTELKTAYKELSITGDMLKIFNHKPVLFVDFSKKILLSKFFDQALENRLIPGWSGKFEDFFPLIPENQRYWEVVA
mgnify:CR=1 FL=1